MLGQFSLSMITFFFVIANKICATYSQCYLDRNIVNQVAEEHRENFLNHPELSHCLMFTKVDCDEDLETLYSNPLPNNTKQENGRANIQLSTRLWHADEPLLLNATANNIWGKKLTIRLQSDKDKSYNTNCHSIDLGVAKNFNLSGLFFVPRLLSTTVEFFVEADGSYYFRKYGFKVPDKNTISECKRIIRRNHMFTYVDISIPRNVRLYVQPLHACHNVTTYNGSVMCEQKIYQTFTLSRDKLYYDWNHSPISTRMCYFEIIPITAKCFEECDTLSAEFIMQKSSHHLIVMIVSAVFVPFAIFFALHQAYIWYINHVWNMKERKPYCLLVHPGSPVAHVKVMIALAEYLRACNINAMIDVLDIPKEHLNNPNLWCQEAFEKATTIIVAGTPHHHVDDSKPMYRLLYDFSLQLIHANSHLNDKNYITLKLPYCKRLKDIPRDARSFKVIKLPKDLNKLVNKIHNIDYKELHKIPSKKELLKSIEMTEKSMFDGHHSSMRIDVIPFSSETTNKPTADNTKIRTIDSDVDSSDPDSVTDDDDMWLGEMSEDKDDEEEEIIDSYGSDKFFSGKDNEYRCVA